MKKIVIIGSGISGLTCLHLLDQKYDITILEKNDYFGGHTRTKEIDYDGVNVTVDTGFIVFNKKNYPNFTKLLERLKVEYQSSEMSFSVSSNNIEYAGTNLGTIFADISNIVNPRFLRLLYDILKFNRSAMTNAKNYPNMTLGELLEHLKLSKTFRDYYITPMGGSIWSMSTKSMLDFPALSFVTFFENHGLLTTNNQPEWYTITNGAKNYVDNIINSSRSAKYTKGKVIKIEKSGKYYEVFSEKGSFITDHIIFACHSDEALSLLPELGERFRKSLEKIKYKSSKVFLHRDTSLMPKRKRCWSSWNFLSSEENSISLTYYMNKLQAIPREYPTFVTLDPDDIISELVFEETELSHPQYNHDVLQAQQFIRENNGEHKLFFVGAYLYNGFHEDGINSSLDVVRMLDGVEI